MTSNLPHFVSYRKRRCTDVCCLIIFLVFAFIYGLFSMIIISQGHPSSLIQASDSLGNLCGQNEFQTRPYQFYFDISKCLTDNALSFQCPTTKICVESCPNYYSHYQSLNVIENTGYILKNQTRSQLRCMYNYDPIADNRSIIEIVQDGLCAPYTIVSEPFLGRCLPSILADLFDSENNRTLTSTGNVSVEQINNQVLGIDSITDLGKVILVDLDRIKDSLALFILLACVLALIYMLAVKLLTSLVVFLTLTLFLMILFGCSIFCWYTISTGDDLVYEYSTIARIINDFIKLKTIYYIVGTISTISFVVGLVVICALIHRIRLCVVLLEQGAKAVFSVLSTLLWSPLIVLIFIFLTLGIVYVDMSLTTVGKPIFRMMINNESVPCLPDLNSSAQCLFQQDYGYDSLTLNGTDPITRSVIESLVDNKQILKWFNLFAYLWFAAFLFAFEEIVLAGVFANFYWSKQRLRTYFPLFSSLRIILRYHLGSIAFGSLLIATLKYIRMIFEYITRKVDKFQENIVIKFLSSCFGCLLWIFEKFLKFLNKNSYILIASRGYTFCKATRKTFGYILDNSLRFLVLVHLTEWILFCGIITISVGNTCLFYEYLQWTNEYEQLILRWTPIIVILVSTYLITSLFFSVYDMAIKTLFICFLQDLDENDGSIERPYMMNNELLHLVHKTNDVEKK